MKILKLSPNYLPERDSGTHLCEDIEQILIENGHSMHYVVPMPSKVDEIVRREYKHKKSETLKNGKVTVQRFALAKEKRSPIQRAFRYLACNLIQYSKGVRIKDADVVIEGSTPPTQGLMCARVKKKLHIPFVYHLQDVFPDSLVTAGLSSKGSLIWRIGRKIEDKTYAAADRIIVITDSMKENLLAKGVPEEKIAVIPNWVDTDDVKPVAKEDNQLFSEYQIDSNKFTVVYAGNFGEAQGTDVILKAAELLKNQTKIQFVLFGTGSRFEEASKKAKELPNVAVHPILPPERISEVYSLGSVALITCKKNTGKSSMPSKTWSIMACNTPIIASFDTDSELAEVLKTSGSGVTVEPENPKALAKAILDASEHPLHGEGGRRFVETHADKKICLQRYLSVVESVKKERR